MLDKEHLEILEGVESEVDQDSHFDKYGRVYNVAISLFLVFLMMSFVFVRFPVGDIIAGYFIGDVVGSDGILSYSGGEIIFSENVLFELSSEYISDEGMERSICLSGEIIGSDYIIDSYYYPEIYSRSFGHVSFESCSSGTLIGLHSHPFGRCKASSVDLGTLAAWKSVDSSVLMLIQCGKKRFSVVGE